ncbi:NADH dehydrogenase of ubiquinone 1 alpha subcomplex subunit 9 [Spatholobus suberectus]|nr:NADH dehydrogenase of ubiquinone 1 alpha subcomplex subunit 9 [Spatholobus suberectus]
MYGHGKMQSNARPLRHQSLKPSTSLKSIYPIFDHHYRVDHKCYLSTLATKGMGYLVCKGTGGQSFVSGIFDATFGATRFLGRYVVQQHAKNGSKDPIPFRGSEDSHRHLKLIGDLGHIVPMKYNPRDESSVKVVMTKVNIVINLIEMDYKTRNYSFMDALCVYKKMLNKQNYQCFINYLAFLF